MKKKRKSISAIFTIHQFTIVAVILLFFMAAGFALIAAERRSAQQERSSQLSEAQNAVRNRLERIDSSVFETLTTTSGSYGGLWSTENGKKVIDKLRLKQLIYEKQILNTDMRFFFAFCPGDFMIFQPGQQTTVPFEERIAVKDWLESELPRDPADFNRRWMFYEIGGRKYIGIQFYLRSEDFYIGVLADPEQVFSELIFLADIYEGSAEVTDFRGGSFSWTDESLKRDLWNPVSEDIVLTEQLSMTISLPIGSFTQFGFQLLFVVFAALVLSFVLIVLNNRRLRKKVIAPVQQLSGELREIEDVTQMKPVSENTDVVELRTLETTLNTLLSEVIADRMQLYENELQKKEQELTLLRSQIRPHFFLNAITTVSAMTYQNRNDDIRDYLMKLSGYIRYVIGTEETYVTLEQELSNIDNYFEMQEIRFPQKAMVFIDCEEEAKKTRLPKYLLLTIVENAFKYAMGQTEFMEVLISCRSVREEDFTGVTIAIEDNGPGFSEEQLRYYNSEQPALDADGHIGLKNVRRTLELHYGKSSLMRVENVLPSGARIEIRIPEETEVQETEGDTEGNEGTDR